LFLRQAHIILKSGSENLSAPALLRSFRSAGTAFVLICGTSYFVDKEQRLFYDFTQESNKCSASTRSFPQGEKQYEQSGP
jgi:hypothetical protein